MRLRVGQIVNVDEDVNLADLSPIDRIIAAGINAYRNTGMYRRRYAETEEKKEEQRRKIRETLIDSILSVITQELEGNTLASTKGDICAGLLLEIPARFKSFLAEAIEAHEFDAYTLNIIPPSRLLSKYADPPYRLYVTHRGG